jgi:hypothetical protein
MFYPFDAGMHFIDQKGKKLCPGHVAVQEDIELARPRGKFPFDAFFDGYDSLFH